MSSRKLSPRQTQALDFQVRQLEQSFARAVRTMTHQDAVWARGVVDAYSESLRTATDYSAFRDFTRTADRARVFDRYILPISLTLNPSIYLADTTDALEIGSECLPLQTHYTERSLLHAIDNRKTSYTTIDHMANALAHAHQFSAIVHGLQHVKDRYRK